MKYAFVTIFISLFSLGGCASLAADQIKEAHARLDRGIEKFNEGEYAEAKKEAELADKYHHRAAINEKGFDTCLMPDGGAEWESVYEKMSDFLSIEVGTLRAHSSLMLKEYDDAIANATGVVALCNKNDTWNKACWERYQEANYVRGTAYLSKGEPEQAISVLLWVKKNSEIYRGPARYNLGVGYYNLGKYEEAMAEFDWVEKNDKANSQEAAKWKKEARRLLRQKR